MTQKRLTTQGLSTAHLIYIILSLAMIFVSIYLTAHFYEAHFPKGLGEATSSLCSGTGFWGCNKATTSALGHIFYIPTSYFGIIIGLLGIIGAIFPSDKMEANNKLFIYLNALGCLFLLLFSLIVLKGLCQFCTVYYVLSFLSAFMFFKYSDLKFSIHTKALAFYALIIILPGIYMNSYFQGKNDRQESLSKQYIDQFKILKDLGEPNYESLYKINIAHTEHEKAPIRISVFSDFQCPFCQSVSDQMHELLIDYKDKVNIQYYFYPLDMNCNPKVKRDMHQYACMAAYLAACDEKKFLAIHDHIFKFQSEINRENLMKWEKDFGLKNCFDREDLKDIIQQSINVGDQFNLKSTPTIIVNGRKIEGSIPTVHLKAIINSLLEDAK